MEHRFFQHVSCDTFSTRQCLSVFQRSSSWTGKAPRRLFDRWGVPSRSRTCTKLFKSCQRCRSCFSVCRLNSFANFPSLLKRTLFLFFLFLADAGSCMRLAAKKEKPQIKKPLNTRGCLARTPQDILENYKSLYTNWRDAKQWYQDKTYALRFHGCLTGSAAILAFLSCSVYFVRIPERHVLGPKTEHESFFLGRWSRVCGWRLCERKKKIIKKPSILNCAKFRGTVWPGRFWTFDWTWPATSPHMLRCVTKSSYHFAL